MRDTLSIIMPAFNSERTIRLSVESVFRQSLTIPFELIIIDDGSSDTTPEIIADLKKRYSKIRFLRNKGNKGGGFSRNYGINSSKGSIIFCLDSDDILPDGMLHKMVSFFLEKKVDGVLFEESRFFISTTRFTMSSRNPRELLGAKIRFRDLFSTTSFLTQVNFMYSKESWKKVGGYPIHHGFDTQGFGYKFLAAGFQAQICPESFYYHRQGYGKSYYEREYEKGALSVNYFYILESTLYRFSSEVLKNLLSYDVFTNSDIDDDNLVVKIRAMYAEFGSRMFSPYKSWEQCFQAISKKKRRSVSDNFLLASYFFLQRDYEKAQKYYQMILDEGEHTPLVYFNVLRCLSRNDIPVIDVVSSISLKPQVSKVSQSLFRKFLRKGVQLLALERKSP